MPLSLENPFLSIEIRPARAAFTIESRSPHGPLVQNALLSCRYTWRGRQARSLDQWPDPEVGRPEPVAGNHGPARQLSLTTAPDRAGLRYTLTFALPENLPLLLWRVQIAHTGSHPVFMRRIEMLQAGFLSLQHLTSPRAGLPPEAGRIRLHPHGRNPAFFSNGWGSWNFTGAYGLSDHFRRTRLGPFTSPMRVNAGTPQPRKFGHFAGDMFGVLGDRTTRTGILTGFLSQRRHFGSLEALADPSAPALSLWANGDDARLDPGATLETDWACLHFLHLDTPDPLGPYLEAVAREHGLAPIQPKSVDSAPSPTGWCSWYHYFQAIDAPIIRENLRVAASLAAELPLQLIQIDDGYEKQVGDWLAFREGFPGGPAALVEEIAAAGFTPGLWLAPFIVHPRARLAQTHPDWLLRSKKWPGQRANAGFIWNVFDRALDLTHPEALAYVEEVVGTAAHAWGFPYLKLDFLYAAALPGRYRDATRTRAQVLRAGLEAIRAAAGPETALLGCGCPLGPAIGLFEAMRIGPDVAPHWHPRYFGTRFLFGAEPDFPAVRNAVHNTLTRAPLHRRWWINDPDCLLLRPESDLTLAEVQTLATAIALSGGSLLLSDALSKLPASRMRIAKILVPLIGRTPHILDWFDSPTPTRIQLDLEGPTGRWHLIALFNWDDRPRDLVLDPAQAYLDTQKTYLAREFWRGETFGLGGRGAASRGGISGGFAGGKITLEEVPSHGCALFSVRVVHPYPQYVGSDLHISQGLEVSRWEVSGSQLRVGLSRPGRAEGQVVIALPGPPAGARLDGQPLSWETAGPGRYTFPVVFEGGANLEILLGDSLSFS